MIDLIVRLTYFYLLYTAYDSHGLLGFLLVVLGYYTAFHWIPRLFGMVALTGGDAFFLNDIPTNKQYVLGTCIYERMTREEYTYIIHNRTFATENRFRHKIIKMLGTPYWVKDPDFSIDKHLKVIDRKIPNEAALNKFVEEYITEPIDFTKSPWEVIFIENYEDDKSVGIVKEHHSLFDGLAAMSIIVSLADPIENGTPGFANLKKKSMFSNLGFFTCAMLYLPIAMVKQLIRRPDKNFIHGKALTGQRSFWSSGRIPLSIVKDYSKRKNVTINTTMLSCLGEGVQALFKNHEEPAESFTLYMPIAMRNLPSDSKMLPVENNISYLMTKLPTNLKPGESRLALTHTFMESLKTSFDPLINNVFMKAVGNIFPMTIARPLIHSTGSQCTMLYSNVPGPQRTLLYCNKKLLNLFVMACGTGNCGVHVTSISYDGGIYLGVTCDKAFQLDAKELEREIESEILKLKEA